MVGGRPQGNFAALRSALWRPARRRHSNEISAGTNTATASHRLPHQRRSGRPRRPHEYARCHGLRRHLRSPWGRVSPLQHGSELVRAAFREDALRQRPAPPDLRRCLSSNVKATVPPFGRRPGHLSQPADDVARRRVFHRPGRPGRRCGGRELRLDPTGNRRRARTGGVPTLFRRLYVDTRARGARQHQARPWADARRRTACPAADRGDARALGIRAARRHDRGPGAPPAEAARRS